MQDLWRSPRSERPLGRFIIASFFLEFKISKGHSSRQSISPSGSSASTKMGSLTEGCTKTRTDTDESYALYGHMSSFFRSCQRN